MSEDVKLNPESGTVSPGESLESSKTHALQAAEELRSAASAKAQELRRAAEQGAHHLKDTATEKANIFKDTAGERATQVRDAAESGWGDAKVKAKDFQAETETYIRDNPTKAVLTALGVGFVLGLIIRR